MLVPDLDHLNVVVWAIARTGRASDACRIIDDDLAAVLPMNRPGRTWDHADRIMARVSLLFRLLPAIDDDGRVRWPTVDTDFPHHAFDDDNGLPRTPPEADFFSYCIDDDGERPR